MKTKLYHIFLLLLAILTVSCNKDKNKINLSMKEVEFKYTESSSNVYSGGSGFYLDAIIVDGKIVSFNENTEDGSLKIASDWLTVTTPGSKSGNIAYSMLITASLNTSKSDRECKILVHNGNEKVTITVKQRKAE